MKAVKTGLITLEDKAENLSFLSDPGPSIVYACQSLSDQLDKLDVTTLHAENAEYAEYANMKIMQNLKNMQIG